MLNVKYLKITSCFISLSAFKYGEPQKLNVKMTIENLIQEASHLEENYKSYKTRNEKIIASKKAKELVLGINEVYKETKDSNLMDIMKRITEIKIKLEKRLKGRLTS